jgi:hypothetical protein
MTDHTSDRKRGTTPFIEECGFCQENLEAFALGALDEADRARAQRHLDWCGPCRRAVAEIREVTDILGLAAAEAAPSPMAKALLFQRIADEANVDDEPVVTFGNPWATTPAIVPEEPTIASDGTATPPWRSWLASALVAPLAIALIIVGAWANSMRNDINDLQANQGGTIAQDIAPGISQGELRLYSMEPSCPECDETPASGHLGGNPDENVGILVASNLDPTQGHQVWCEKRNGELLLISDLQVEQSGDVVQTVAFPDAIGGYSTIYVTRHDGTEEMRVALSEELMPDESTPEGDLPAGD